MKKAGQAEVAIIVAISGKGRGVGNLGKLLWHISEDLKQFKRLSLGHPVIMGRRTFESIEQYLRGPLPGRTNIVITRNPTWQRESVLTFSSLEEALEHAHTLDTERIVIGGGSEVYTQALPHTNKLYLTIIDDKKEADVFFPPYEHLFTRKTREEKRTDEKTGLSYTWLDLER